MFLRVGITQEVLSDQGNNFMSQLLMEIYIHRVDNDTDRWVGGEIQ